MISMDSVCAAAPLRSGTEHNRLMLLTSELSGVVRRSLNQRPRQAPRGGSLCGMPTQCGGELNSPTAAPRKGGQESEAATSDWAVISQRGVRGLRKPALLC